MSEHQDFVDQAGLLFSGSTVTSTDTYDQAKVRLLTCIREGAPDLAQVDRWGLACEAACLSRAQRHEPYGGWAGRLIETDLTDMIAKFRAAGVDPGEDSADPLRWIERRPVTKDVRRLIHQTGWRPSFDEEFRPLPDAYAAALEAAADYSDSDSIDIPF